jgi:hypothetical protein
MNGAQATIRTVCFAVIALFVILVAGVLWLKLY